MNRYSTSNIVFYDHRSAGKGRNMENQVKQLLNNVKTYCKRIALLTVSVAFAAAILITLGSEAAKNVLAFAPVQASGSTKENVEYAFGELRIKDYSVIQNEKMVEQALAMAGEVEPEIADVEEKPTEIVAAAEETAVSVAAPVYANAASIPGYEYIGTFETTGYCPCARCCGKTNGITASGTLATANHTIAADTSVLPFGTQVVINGQVYTVEDRGGAIRGGRIDIFFASHQEALNYGRRRVDVYRYVGVAENASSEEATSQETEASTELLFVSSDASTETSLVTEASTEAVNVAEVSTEVSTQEAVAETVISESTEATE